MARLYERTNDTWNEYNAKSIYKKENGYWVKRDFSILDEDMRYIYESLEGKIKINYVSFGDSIAAGHTINERWEKDYGRDSQYGANGNKYTAIVPGCYTDLLTKQLRATYGAGNVNIKSFAKSGNTLDDVVNQLDDTNVVAALADADLVTLCVGANNVLHPAMNALEDYIYIGDSALEELNTLIVENYNKLLNDDYKYSVRALLNKLYSINPNATYLFTNIYSPYKYLWIEEGRNGFFKPLLDVIPSMPIDIDKIIEDMFNIDDLGYPTVENWQIKWNSIELNIDLGNTIKDGLLSTEIVKLLFRRVNGLGDYSTILVENLNNVLTAKINQFGKPNFRIVDTKAAFDVIPDRIVPAEHHYNDLVSVEFTRGYDTAQMDWGALWRDTYGTSDEAIAKYWGDLAWKYLSFKNALPSWNVWDYVSFDMEGFAEDLIKQVVEKVIEKDLDPHPEEYGQEVMFNTFWAGYNSRRI